MRRFWQFTPYHPINSLWKYVEFILTNLIVHPSFPPTKHDKSHQTMDTDRIGDIRSNFF